MAGENKLDSVDLVRIGNLLEHLAATDNTTCEGWDRIIFRIGIIVWENDFAEYTLYSLSSYGRSNAEVLEHIKEGRPLSNRIRHRMKAIFPD